MDRNDVATFAELLWDHCNCCKHIRPGWGPDTCKNQECWFHQVRLLRERVRCEDRGLEKILKYRLT